MYYPISITYYSYTIYFHVTTFSTLNPYILCFPNLFDVVIVSALRLKVGSLGVWFDGSWTWNLNICSKSLSELVKSELNVILCILYEVTQILELDNLFVWCCDPKDFSVKAIYPSLHKHFLYVITISSSLSLALKIN